MNVRKAVIPAAGLGTRFLPATRSVPKVLLPVLDTPSLHLAVSEAALAGIEHIMIVLSPEHSITKTYFERSPTLEKALENLGKTNLLEKMQSIAHIADINYIYQHEQKGLGHAVLMTKKFVGAEPFAVFLPDDIIWDNTSTISRMITIFNEYQRSVIAVKEVPDEAVPNLGIVDHRPIDDSISKIISMVEKPNLAKAPSNLAIIGRYILTPHVFDKLSNTEPGAIGEIQLTDAISALIQTQDVYSYRFPGVHIDAGTPIGLLKASIYQTLHSNSLANELRSWLENVL